MTLIQKYATKTWLLLTVIIIVGLLLRFVQLGTNPPALNWDEAAWGYNAYSLGIDGRDEFGRFLPITYLESYGDYKPPAYAYLDVLPVKIFGLTEFATRFPSAFLGTLTILVAYFLVKRMFYTSKRAKIYGLITAAMLAISPWHILLSRAAFEANVASFFLILGVWLFLEALDSRPFLLVFSVVSFVITLYTFNTERIVSPLMVLGLIVINYKKLWNMKKWAAIALCVGIILTAPTVPFLVSKQARLRFQEVNIFSDPAVVINSNEEIANDNNAAWSKALHNRRLAYGVDFLKHYFDNLSVDFLFIKGDGNPRFSTQVVGEMYLWELPFFVLGLLWLFKFREGKWYLIPFWLLIGIIPAATAEQTPHALRIEATLPTFQFISGYGLLNAILLTKTNASAFSPRKILIYCVIIASLLNFIYFVDYYFVNYARDYSGEWQYGYKQAVDFETSVDSKYQYVYFTQSLGRPYIYFLFYKQFNPILYRSEADTYRDQFGFVTIEKFGKYYFNKDLIPKNAKSVLYFDVPGQVPTHAHIVKQFYLLNGATAVTAYTL